MADHTIVNLREAEDQAPRFGMAPDVQARFPRRELGLRHSGISLQRLAPGARQPFGHRHGEQEEVYVVTAGSGSIALDGEVVEIGPWDAVRVAGPVTRALEAGDDGLEFLAFGAPRPADDPEWIDAEIEPGWWPDDRSR